MSKPNSKERIKEIKKKIKAIDKRYEQFLQEIKLPLVKKEDQVQPATFQTKFNNNVTIMTQQYMIKCIF